MVALCPLNFFRQAEFKIAVIFQTRQFINRNKRLPGFKFLGLNEGFSHVMGIFFQYFLIIDVKSGTGEGIVHELVVDREGSNGFVISH